MKPNRSIHPGVESLEGKTLLSTGVALNLPSQVKGPLFAAESASIGTHLTGTVVNGYGGVSPLGAVHGYLNIAQKTVILANARGSLKLQLSHVHHYPYVVNAFGWSIIHGTGTFATYQGQGSCALTAVVVSGRIATWTAIF